MIKLRIKIKSDSNTYTHLEFLHDDYNISKQNKDLISLVEKTCRDSNIEEIQDVIVSATFDW